MVRGRRRTPTTNQKHLTDGGSLSNMSPGQHVKSQDNCRGKVVHMNSGNPITEYFKVRKSTSSPSQENGEISNKAIQDSLSTVDNLSRKVLQDTNNRLEIGDHLSKAGDSDQNVTIKTETCVPLSPSAALSRLHLNNSKKVAKLKLRRVGSQETTENAQNVQKTITEFFPIRRSGRKTKKHVLEEKRKMIEEAVLSNKEDGLEVRNFGTKGRGVVAVRHFAKGDFVVEYAGELISLGEAEKREEIYALNENIGCYMYYFKHKNNRHCVDATAETGRLGRLLNHSKNGNLTTKTIEVKGIPRLILLAKEDIKPESELTYDYGDRSKQSLQYHPWLAQ